MMMYSNLLIAILVSFLSVAPLQAVPLKPVVYISFDEAEGGVIEDQVTGEEIQLNSVSRIDGKFKKAVRFNGKNSSASFGKGNTVSPAGTVEFWVKPETVGGTVIAFSAGGNHYFNNLLAVEYNIADESIRVLSRWGGLPYPHHWIGKSPAGSVPKNKWSLIDLVQDGKHPKLYINGRLALEISEGKDLTSWTHTAQKTWFGWIIGSNHVEGDGAMSFQGAIDEIRIYNQPLTQPQIQGHFEGKYEPVDGTLEFKPDGNRQIANLSGLWQFLPVWQKQLTYPPAPGKWKKIQIPNCGGGRSDWQQLAGEPPAGWDETSGDGYFDGPGKSLPFAWYKKTVELTELPAGNTMKLVFDAVAHLAWVYVNGTLVCEHIGGTTPFEVDVTKHVRPGKNEILVGAGDQRSLARNRNWLREAVFFPTGAQYPYHVGIWQDVRLVVRPDASIDDVFVMPSVRNMKLDVQTTLKHEGKQPFKGTIKAVVTDAGKCVKEFKDISFSIDPGQEKVLTLSEPFEKAQLWWPDSPKLYHVTVTLDEDGKTVDTQTRRFGFREFWIDGRSFRLNGAKVKLWNIWGHTGEYMRSGAWEGPEGARRVWRTLKENNLVAARLHAQPMVPWLLDTADEEGILLIDESALYDGGHQFFDEPPYQGKPVDELYRQNAYTHIREWVRRDRNHPSVVIWSGSNEFAFWCTPRNKKVTAFLQDLSSLIRTLDPTRPVKHSGYGALDGKEMTIDLHYPQDSSAPPNGFFWATGNKGGKWYYDANLGGIYCNIQWNGEKPLCVGEDSPRMDSSVLIGEKANQDDKERLKGFVEMWRMLFNAYRLQDIAMESPALFHSEGARVPNSHLSALKDVFKPLGIFLKEYPRRFFAGQKVARTLIVYNETYRTRDMTLAWNIYDGDKTIGQGTQTISLPPGELAEIPVTFDAPAVADEKNLILTAVLREGDTDKDTFTSTFRIYPSKNTFTLPAGKLALFDPNKQTAETFKKLGIPFETLDSLNNVKKDSIVVIGQNALPENLSVDLANSLKTFVENGGTIVCLDQKKFPRWLPVRLEPAKDSRATVAFVNEADHPILKGIDPSELQFWAKDNIVAENLFQKPSSGPFKTLITAGGGSSLTPLCEIPYGKGAYLICQMPLVARISAEPVCRKLLQGILTYAMDRKPSPPVQWNRKDTVSLVEYREKDYIPVDLTARHNRNFQEEIATDKMMYSAWVQDRIEPIGDLPSGKVTFEGVPFTITLPTKNGGKNCIALRSKPSIYTFIPTPYIQNKAVIDLKGRFSRLYFLHTLSCNWTSEDNGSYVIRYADGAAETIPLSCGTNIESWPATPPRIMPYAKPVWRGIVPGPEEATLYMFEWVNPFPEKNIVQIEFQLKPSTAIPILVALTGRSIDIENSRHP